MNKFQKKLKSYLRKRNGKKRLQRIIRQEFSAERLKTIYNLKGKRHFRYLKRLSKWVQKNIWKYNSFDYCNLPNKLDYDIILSNVLMNLDKLIFDYSAKENPSVSDINRFYKILRKLKRIEL